MRQQRKWKWELGKCEHMNKYTVKLKKCKYTILEWRLCLKDKKTPITFVEIIEYFSEDDKRYHDSSPLN